MEQLDAEFLRSIHEAALADPDAMRRFVDDIPPPNEPIQDYLTDMDIRRALFDEFRTICLESEPDQVVGVPHATILAVFLVAPISEIRSQLDSLRDLEKRHRRDKVIAMLVCAPPALGAYIPKARSADKLDYPPLSVHSAILNEPGTSVPSSSVKRSGFADQVKDRDGHACVFSGMPDPEAAHIFPFSTSKKRGFQCLNDLLTAFWGNEKANAWGQQFQDAGITQSARNGLSMNHQIHFWFDNARFALRPLAETPQGIVVQWHWLKRSVLKPKVHIHREMDILHQAGVMDQRWGDADALAHRESGVRIQTGQTFLIRHHAHMPSWELLEMQWDLLRVAALCGAADVTEEYYDTQDEDDRSYDQAVAAKQRSLLAEYEKTEGEGTQGEAEVADRGKGKGVGRKDAKEEHTRE